MAKKSHLNPIVSVAIFTAAIIAVLLIVVGALSWRLEQAEARPVGICQGQAHDRPPVDLWFDRE
jgi:hypothetical protein